MKVLGRKLPAAAAAWLAASGVLLLALRLVYPVAAVLAGKARGALAMGVVIGAMALALAAQHAGRRAARAVRPVLYGALGAAAHRYPTLAAREPGSPAELEATIARGAPSAEMYLVQTLPSLAASAAALPCIAVLAFATVGRTAAWLGTLTVLIAAALGLATARHARRLAQAAWKEYRHVARLVEQGIRGRAELRAQDLGPAYEARLAERVDTWSAGERGAAYTASFGSALVPPAALAVAAALLLLIGQSPVALATRVLSAPDPAAVLGGLLAFATLPALGGLVRSLSQAAIHRPQIAALERFVAASDPPQPHPPSAPAPAAAPLGPLRLLGAAHDYPAAASGRPVRVQADLRWDPGEALALCGPSGSGKTTVLLLAAGLLEPASGSVAIDIDGHSVPPSALAGRIAYLSQTSYFDDRDTVRDAIRFAAPAPDAAIADLLARLTGIEGGAAPWLDRPLGSLSAGQRRLVAIARTLLRDAELVLLDEPESSLDPATRRRLADVLAAVTPSRRLLLSTHDEPLAQAAGCRLLRFEGHAVRDGEGG